MSRPLINRSPDLQRLRDEGYEISIKAGYLLVSHIPYVTAERVVKYGTLVSSLSLAGDVTVKPQDHQTYFIGEVPCSKDGKQLTAIISSISDQKFANDLVINVAFSSKPREGGYRDYHHKMTTYAMIIFHQAQAIEPGATPLTGRAIPSEGDDDGVFHYLDTASTRVGIGAVTEKLAGRTIGIVGLGGTGSYVLDLIAKTPVAEIRLYDDDHFLQHNAFRSPGAASSEELAGMPLKVEHYAAVYSRIHRRVLPHPVRIDRENVALLDGIDFAFLCIDKASAKQAMVDFLEARGIPFIDVGMGVELIEAGQLVGILRVTTSTPEQRGSFKQRVGFSDPAGEGLYPSNIQIADLNCLNAALAVIKWKKLCGFYNDAELEHHSTYSINVNMLLSEDHV